MTRSRGTIIANRLDVDVMLDAGGRKLLVSCHPSGALSRRRTCGLTAYVISFLSGIRQLPEIG